MLCDLHAIDVFDSNRQLEVGKFGQFPLVVRLKLEGCASRSDFRKVKGALHFVPMAQNLDDD